jgi:hypothetical protein
VSDNPRQIHDDFPTVDNPPRRDVAGERSMLSPKTALTWPCKRCGADVEVYQGALDAMEAFNRLLAKQGEHPINTRDTLWCDPCGELRAKARAKHNAEVSEKIRQCCALMRDPGTPAHLLGDAESFVGRAANNGKDIVLHYAELRRKAGKTRSGI